MYFMFIPNRKYFEFKVTSLIIQKIYETYFNHSTS